MAEVITSGGNGGSLSPVFNVKTLYGAVGDGVTDDTGAIQNAITAAGAAGGGIVYFPAGTYLCNTIKNAGNVYWALEIISNNVTLLGAGRDLSVLKTTAASGLFWIGGSPTGAVNWATFRWQDQAVLAISSALRGAITVTTTTPADAGTFAAGDFIYLRCGQLTTNAGATEPDAEINQVMAVNAGTGVITLRWPLAKDYNQQNYPAGHASAGSPAPFGILKATSSIIQNVVMRDLGMRNTTATTNMNLIAGWQIYGWVIEDCALESDNNSLFNCYSYRNFRFARNRHRIDSTDAAANLLYISVATGVGDGIITESDMTARCSGVVHLHEGSHGITLSDCLIDGGTTGPADSYRVSIRARAWDHKIVRNTIIHRGTGLGSCIYVDDQESGGGLIAENTVDHGVDGTDSAIWVNNSRWTVGHNTFINGDMSFYNNNNGGRLINGVAPRQMESFSNWVAWNTQATTATGVNALNSATVNVDSTSGWPATGSFVLGGVATTYTGVTATSFTGCGNHAATTGGEAITSATPTATLGTLPSYCIPVNVHLYVDTLFNSSGTDQIKVGWSGNTQGLALNVDVSTTGVKTLTLGSEIGKYLHNTPKIVQAIYTPSVVDDTTGKALVTIEFYRVVRRVA